MLFKEDTLENYFTITGFNIETLFSDYLSFQDNESQSIINYYSGIDKFARVDSFNLMYELIKKTKEASQLFYFNRDAFNSTADWNLLDQLDRVRISLETLSNSNKYLRSSINKNQFNIGIEIDLALKQYDTLESLESRELASQFPQNDWVDLALYNDLAEEDYTPKGGTLLKSPTSNFNITFLNSVVGSLQGENLYGKDLNRRLTFSDDDLSVLSPKDTIKQAINILMNLSRGDNPFFPNDGIQKSLFIGNNMAGMSYPVLFRQILSTYAKDDTISRISMVNISTVQDSIQIEYEIQTKYGEKFNDIKIL